MTIEQQRLVATPQLHFTVLGRARAKGSMKAIPAGGYTRLTDSNPALKSWERDIKLAGRQAMRAQGLTDLLASALAVTVDFYFQRPKGHYGSGRNALRVRAGAPAEVTTAPDLDKLVRALDALTGQVWRDDSQIVELHARKRYGDPERMELTIW